MTPIHVAFLLFPDVMQLDLTGPAQVLLGARGRWRCDVGDKRVHGVACAGGGGAADGV